MTALLVPASFALAQGGEVTGSSMQEEKEKEEQAAQSKEPAHVLMETSKGGIVLELNREEAPITVENFLRYVNEDAYDGTIFHRVMKGFMIQGGGFDADLNKRDTHDPIKNEWQNGLSNVRGTIAMARINNRHDSATNQFFINVDDNSTNLDTGSDGAGYAVFGKVIEGMDVVDAIRNVETKQQGNFGNLPVETVVIEEATELDDSAFREVMKGTPWMRAKEYAEEIGHPGYHDAFLMLLRKDVDITQGELMDDGLWTVTVQEGEGEESPSVSTEVTVHYTGWLLNGKTFSSSRGRGGAPLTDRLGDQTEGWQRACTQMVKGERRYLVIPHQLAYGERGQRSIPPRATLIFDVELLDF